MAIKKVAERQWKLAAVHEFTPQNAADTFEVDLPPGAILTNIIALKDTAFNTGGATPTVTLTGTDGTTTFISAEVLTGTGLVTVDAMTKYYPLGGTLTFTVAQGAASGMVLATAGKALIQVEYTRVGRDNEKFANPAS